MFKLFKRTGGAPRELGKTFKELNILRAIERLKHAGDVDEVDALEEIAEHVIFVAKQAVNACNDITINARLSINLARLEMAAFERELDLLLEITRDLIDDSEVVRDLYRTALAYYAMRTVFEMKGRLSIPILTSINTHLYDYTVKYIQINQRREIQAPSELRETFVDVDTYAREIDDRLRLLDIALNDYNLRSTYKLFKEVLARAEIIKATYDTIDLRDLGYDIDSKVQKTLSLISEELEGAEDSEAYFTQARNKNKII